MPSEARNRDSTASGPSFRSLPPSTGLRPSWQGLACDCEDRVGLSFGSQRMLSHEKSGFAIGFLHFRRERAQVLD